MSKQKILGDVKLASTNFLSQGERNELKKPKWFYEINVGFY